VSSRPCVVLTREPADNQDLREALEARGVPVRELPCAETAWLDPGPIREGAAAVAFASRRAVRGLLASPAGAAVLAAVPRPLVAAVGPSTRAEVEARGIGVDLVADPPTGEALGRALDALLAPGAPVLLPRGDLEGGGVERALARAGRPCWPVLVYENREPPLRPEAPFPTAAVFVAAPSAARRLLAALPWLRAQRCLAIGPTTRDALLAAGAVDVGVTGTDPGDQLAAVLAAWTRAAARGADPTPSRR